MYTCETSEKNNANKNGQVPSKCNYYVFLNHCNNVLKYTDISSCSYYRILATVYNFQRYWVFGLYPSPWY
jgi:hypothetical protein